MNKIILLLLCNLGLFLTNMTAYDFAIKSTEVIVKGVNCDQISEMHLFEFDGLGFEKIQSAAKNKDGEYIFKVKSSGKIFRYVGLEVGKFKSIVIGDEDKIIVEGDCSSFNRASVSEGLNFDYNTMMAKIRNNTNTEKGLSTRFAKSYKNEAKKKKLILEFAALDQIKKELIETYTKKDKWLGEVAGLYTYFSYQNSKTDLPNELEYFANKYFAQADLKSSAFEDMPLMFDVFNKYGTILTKVRGLSEAKLRDILNNTLNKVPEKSGARKMALGGVISALKGANNPLFIPFANTYLEQFCKDSKGCNNLKKQIKAAESFIVGGEAPDFTMNNLAGEPVNLSDFKGKVVLIDFWASWCGPCRKDNPHVVKLYNKYKGDGFEILGVSLDKTQNSWEQAVVKDKLTWTQVSDLKGWKNEVAQLYSVKSIPHTVLLDKEGKLIAMKLRGPALDKKLAEIFGH